MTTPPRFFHGTVTALENVALARGTYRLRLASSELARAIAPGQFVMLRFPDRLDPLLGRAFALMDTVRDEHGQPHAIDIGYYVVGKMTRLLERLRPGDRLSVWGPLGKPFPRYDGVRELVLIAGGIGQTPFLALAQRALGLVGYSNQPARRECEQVRLVYGTRTADLLASVEDFQRLGVVVHICTEDGSAGYAGLVTDLLAELPRPQRGDYWVACGPMPMLRAVAKLAQDWQVPCHVSLESPMACGTGICYSCVTPVRSLDGWDYARVCLDGPIFDACQIAWDKI
ncbi:MAG: dihydroorotate dehydrogenase electron transfer subunit [Gemmatales bacterium]|nr:dihydroorotate dehydrogenase electron transfer subunit [Gemmatales bacterium]MDW7993192.1 dihydroorotate dehydrogenase electron transfer subunit [Gemmatales bacterium]